MNKKATSWAELTITAYFALCIFITLVLGAFWVTAKTILAFWHLFV